MARLKTPGWRTIKALGSGGQAEVFLAKREPDPDGAEYALKVLRNTDVDSQAYGRFCREIDALKKLNHPNVIKVIECSPEGGEGNRFYAMEYIPGAKALKALMKEKSNPFKHNELAACRLFIQIASAIEACQTAGIVHRDLSPANVLILPDGGVKIIDFGICLLGGAERVTQTDENFGTINYRAPECSPHTSTPSDVTTDLYSAGKILWSAITDRPVFERERIAFNDCSMRQVFPEHHNRWHLQRIFEKTIRHDQPKRFQSAAQARVTAEILYGLMATYVLPIEDTMHRCPICKLGTLVAPEKIFKVGAYLLFGQSHPEGIAKRVCDYCGHCFLIAISKLNETLNAMTGIE
jgi:serine/threonine protein kinase